MRREGNRLAPIDPISAEELLTVPADRDVLVVVKQPRNVRQHRLAWALAEKIHEACDWLKDREDAMDFLKIKARHVKYITDPRTGKIEIIPKSIAFASLSQDAFDRVFRRMVYVTCAEIVPGLEEEKLRAEIMNMVA